MNTKALLFTVAISALSLNACSSNDGNQGTENHQSNTSYSNKTSNIINRALKEALKEAKNDQERLTVLGQMHTRDPENQAVAIHYAQALRNDEQINPSKRVLEKFTKGENKSAEALTELSITNIALGDFKAAELNALDALELSPNDGRAYLSMGTALDAQGRHEDAETAFRNGIKNWKGDPAPILNNLALNLASQGRLEQSLEILRKAKKISPHRMEIERNLRIISTLQETAGTPPPSPNTKPAPKLVLPQEESLTIKEKKTETVTKERSKEKSSVPIPTRKSGVVSSSNLNTKAKIDDAEQEIVVKETVEEKEEAKKTVVKYRPLND